MVTEVKPEAMRRITVHYANSPARGTAEANFQGLDHELLGFAFGEALYDQESLYQSILDGAADARGTAPSHHFHHYYHGESSSGAAVSPSTDVDAQIASDEAFARVLQEMEDLSVETAPHEHDDSDMSCVESPSDTDESTNGNNEEEAAARQDDVGPDNMTYEQRQALGESIGTEDRGLSDELISYLESKKYKSSGLFSRKPKNENCVICLATYRNRQRLITLPCKHDYHAACITKWLRSNKTCPVCKYEVFGPS